MNFLLVLLHFGHISLTLFVCHVTLVHLSVEISGPPSSFCLSTMPLFFTLPLLENSLVLCGFLNVPLPQGLCHVLPQAPKSQKKKKKSIAMKEQDVESYL